MTDNGLLANPFAAPVANPWAWREARELRTTLVQFIQQQSRINLLYRTAGPGLMPLNLAQAPDPLWQDALEQLAAAGRLEALSRLLLEEQGLPAVQTAAQEVLRARPAIAKFFGRSGQVTVNRTPLRTQLAELSRDVGPVKVLLIRGDPQSGKTWSRHLFEEAARDCGAEPTYIYSSTAATVNILINKLFSTMHSSDLIPPQDTSSVAWYQDVCNRMPEAAVRLGRPLWIAVDDLGEDPDGAPLMDTEIRRFLEQFVLHLADPAMNRWFRLMLIHYPRDKRVPTRWERDLWVEDLPDPAAVGLDDVADVLREWAVDHGRVLLDTEAARLAQQVLDRADGLAAPIDPDDSRLRRIHDELSQRLSNLGQEQV